MALDHSQNITELLGRWRKGDKAARSELVQEVYPVLQKIASDSKDRYASPGRPGRSTAAGLVVSHGSATGVVRPGR